MSTTTTPKVVDPPFYDPPIVDYASGQQHSQAWTEYHQSVADQLSTLAANQGVTDGSDAAAGQVGEYLTATSGQVALANGVAANVVSLDLTAGDWQVQGSVTFSASGGTHTFFGAGITGIDTVFQATFPAASNQAINTATRRVNVTATTTVWVMAEAGFSGGAVSATGSIQARRAR